jgi:hypothetical protein
VGVHDDPGGAGNPAGATDIGVELFRRQDDGNWPEQPAPIGKDDGVFLDSIGFRAKLGDFYEDTHLRQDGTS